MTRQPLSLWSAEALATIDARACEDLPHLMEVAGAALAAAVLEEAMRVGMSRPLIEVWVGPGNNGGDGLVACRHLLEAGADVRVWMALGAPKPAAAAAAWARLEAFGGVATVDQPQGGDTVRVIVDCLFGIGLKRPVEGVLADAIRAANTSAWPVVACDIPSGLDCDTGRPHGAVLHASRTTTFGALKPGLFFNEGLTATGPVELVRFGLYPSHLDGVAAKAVLAGPPPAGLLRAAPAAHKARFGRVLALAGSEGLEGAALLTLHGLRCAGSGLIHLWAPGCTRASLHGVSPEVMVAPFAEHALELASRCDALVGGPGIGRTPEARRALLSLLDRCPERPWVLDADALWHWSEAAFELPACCLVTPHEGEALRMLGMNSDEWDGDRIALAEAAHAASGAVVLLKGAGNVIADRDGVRVLEGGARALARGGSGDLLAGFLAGLMGRGLSPAVAAHLGVSLQLAAATQFEGGAAEAVGQEALAAALAAAWDVYLAD
jgi:ADP-dependent NAD(P)H-hydrate dehydratase / NAD(P)H-hydrate epimerase